MDITGIIAISGKPGLYKVVGQTKNTLIVESLEDGRRFPANSNNRVSALDDISIYTYQEDLPLVEVLAKVFKKYNGKEAIDHKAKPEELKAFMGGVLPDYDENRVYNSDIKKLIQWYNALVSAGVLKEESKKEEAPKTKKKTSTAKKTAVKKADTSKKSAAPTKKTSTAKTSIKAPKANAKKA